MQTINSKHLFGTTLAAALALGTLGLTSPAQAGKGGSAQAIASALASGSVDALSAELERSERLVCSDCLTMVRPLVDHQDARVRRVATWWLARRGLRSQLFVEMALRLGEPDSRRAQNAADVLGSLRSPRAVEPLGASLNNPAFDSQARVAMAQALGRIGEPAAGRPLLEATAASDPRIRAAALAGLRDLRAPIDAQAVIPLLDDDDAQVRSEAIFTLGSTRGRGLPEATLTAASSALLRRLTQDPEALVRRKAAWALGEIAARATQAQQPLATAALQDRDPAVRSLASAAVTRLSR